ncbi:hypothetical protein SNEBB_005295 [Seison nebaliae]|nr:hypothetical protein SNEBB_005295 [Seison nebaliae]
MHSERYSIREEKRLGKYHHEIDDPSGIISLRKNTIIISDAAQHNLCVFNLETSKLLATIGNTDTFYYPFRMVKLPNDYSSTGLRKFRQPKISLQNENFFRLQSSNDIELSSTRQENNLAFIPPSTIFPLMEMENDGIQTKFRLAVLERPPRKRIIILRFTLPSNEELEDRLKKHGLKSMENLRRTVLPIDYVVERYFADTWLIHPRGICCDQVGHLIVIESFIKRISIFNSQNGKILHWFKAEDKLCFPTAITSDWYRQLIYVCDNRSSSVCVFDYSGKYQMAIGRESVTNYPAAVNLCNDGEILVISDNHMAFNITIIKLSEFVEIKRPIIHQSVDLTIPATNKSSFLENRQVLLIASILVMLRSIERQAPINDVCILDSNSLAMISRDYRCHVYILSDKNVVSRNRQPEMNQAPARTIPYHPPKQRQSNSPIQYYFDCEKPREQSWKKFVEGRLPGHENGYCIHEVKFKTVCFPCMIAYQELVGVCPMLL